MKKPATSCALAVLFLALSSNPVKAEIVHKKISVGHLLCYEHRDLTRASRFAVDGNMAGMRKLIEDGKCFMNPSKNPYPIYRFSRSDEMQAVILPSGEWARVFTYSIED